MKINDFTLFFRSLFVALIGGCLLAGCARTAASPSPARPQRLVYATAEDQFASWPHYLPAGSEAASVTVGTTGIPEIRLKTPGPHKIGVNKLLQIRSGRVEFEYAVMGDPAQTEHLTLFAIPMETSGLRGKGMIEYGSSDPDDPKNGFSSHRRKFSVPPDPQAAPGQWRQGTLEFDFSSLRQITETVIGLRINEGSRRPASGEIAFRNIRVFGE